MRHLRTCYAGSPSTSINSDKGHICERFQPDTENPIPHDTLDTQTTRKRKQPADDAVMMPRTMFNYLVIALVFFVVGIVTGAVSFSQARGTDADTIERIVAEAVAGLEAGSTADSGNDMSELVDDDPSIGDDDAPVVIVEFSAYACPYCGRHFNETVDPLLDNYGEHIRYVYRDYPTINPQVSFPAAMAANCARDQGAFWEYHDALFNNQNQLGDDFFRQLAADLELDTGQFNNCLTDETYYDEVNNDYLDGLVNNISGTPSFYINGEFYSGALPYEFFEK